VLVDLHAHYPMHVIAREQGDTHARIRRWHPKIERWIPGWFRSGLVRMLSRVFNYQGPGDTPSVRLELMQQGDVGVILSVLYCPLDEIDFERPYGAKPTPEYCDDLLKQLDAVELDIKEHQEKGWRARIAHSPAELDAALNNGELVLIHAVEGGFHLGADETAIRNNVKALAEKGIVYITVAHLFWRDIATNAPALPFMPDPLYKRVFPQPAKGLSELGKAAVRAMIEHGVLIDISHMSERGIEETFALVERCDPQGEVPVIAGHTAVRFGKSEYNLPPPIIKRLAERSGLIGLIACEHWMSDGSAKPKSAADSFELIYRHIDRIHQLTGSYEHIAFGTDLDGYIKPALPGLEHLGLMRGLQAALRHRYGPATAQLITSENALRVLRKAWGRPVPNP
jgi:microsomal dipeptidase-like Zn-dependent dipeptidase